MNFRLIESSGTGQWNMAVDESILENVISGKSNPTLRLYSWSNTCVSIGYFQGIHDSINTDKCNELGITILRRTTGGGTVLHDKELTYSFVLPVSLVPPDVVESYRFLCAIILSSLQELGINAVFKPINDILVENKKISGSAQTRRGGCLLQHGTIILDYNPEAMFNVLKINKAKSKGKTIEEMKKSITSINEITGKNPLDELKELIVKNSEKNFSKTFTKSKLTEKEAFLAQKLEKEKYSSHKWTFMR